MAKRGFDFIMTPAQPPTRVALFAIRVVDAASLETIRRGATVEAVGLRGRPIVNGSGLFVWLDENLDGLERVVIDPGSLPFEPVEVGRDGLWLPPDRDPPHLTTIELPPRADYPFTMGTTGLRSRLFESNVPAPAVLSPVAGAAIHLQWRVDEAADWIDAPTVSHTTAEGDFVSILRLGRDQAPDRDSQGRYRVRLQARRDGAAARASPPFTLFPGRINDPTANAPPAFFWDELQP